MAEALKKAPKDSRTYLEVSMWALGIGQLDEARTEASEAIKLDPRSLEAKIIRGEIALYQKDYAAAERFSQDAQIQ